MHLFPSPVSCVTGAHLLADLFLHRDDENEEQSKHAEVFYHFSKSILRQILLYYHQQCYSVFLIKKNSDL